jgi:hypothetical protein
MNEYIVYKKEECDCVYAKNSGDYYGPDICPNCHNENYTLSEVSLEDAIKDLLNKNAIPPLGR